MKITNKSINIETEFRNIKVGEVFYYPFSGAVYMKTETIYEEDRDTVMVNAVNLRSGSLCAFNLSHHVISVDCECVISDRKEV